MEVMKQLRQRAIRDLVEQRPIRTQQELAASLRERGFRTTQATISRDVAELGLIKVTRDGTAAYALPPRLIEAETSGEDRLRKLMVDLPIEIHEAGLLLVVRTLPGSAHAIAAALDRARWPEVAGLDRRRRHAVRRIPGPRLAAADQAPAGSAHRGELTGSVCCNVGADRRVMCESGRTISSISVARHRRKAWPDGSVPRQTGVAARSRPSPVPPRAIRRSARRPDARRGPGRCRGRSRHPVSPSVPWVLIVVPLAAAARSSSTCSTGRWHDGRAGSTPEASCSTRSATGSPTC